jgi:hypothetical protein
MLRKVVGFTKDTALAGPPYRLDFALGDNVFEFAQEFFDVLEVTVHGSKPHIGDFV